MKKYSLSNIRLTGPDKNYYANQLQEFTNNTPEKIKSKNKEKEQTQ
jgi:hypothetical protein